MTAILDAAMSQADVASVVTPGSVGSRLVIRCVFRVMGLLCAALAEKRLAQDLLPMGEG